MKAKIMLAIMCPAVLLTGCISGTSPVPHEAANRVSAGDVGIMAVGTGAGAAIGHAIDGNRGAVIGGALGLVGTAVANNIVADKKAENLAEARADERRKTQAEMFERMWDEGPRTQAAHDDSGDLSTADARKPVRYPAQTVEGVRYAPREGEKPTLTEPTR